MPDHEFTIHTPEDFGAVGDGVADDTAAVQAAFDTGGAVYLARGKTYLVKPESMDYGYVTGNYIFGGGKLKLHPQSQLTDSTVQAVLPPKGHYQVNHANVVIDGIIIDGSRDEVDWSNVSGDGAAHGINVWGGQDIIIRDCIIENCYTDGIYIAQTHSSASVRRNARNVQVVGNTCRNCRRQGISLISGEHIRIVANYWRDITTISPGAGLDIEPNASDDDIRDVAVIGNTSENTKAGILVQGVSRPNRIVIANNVLHKTVALQGIQVRDADNVQVIGNNILHGNGTYPVIHIYGGTNVLVSGNLADGSSVTTCGTQKAAIEVSGAASSRVLIENCMAIKPCGAGVYVSSGHADVVVRDVFVQDANQSNSGAAAFKFEGNVRASGLVVTGTTHKYGVLLVNGGNILENCDIAPGTNDIISGAGETDIVRNIMSEKRHKR